MKKLRKRSLLIGIPARNEEENIQDSLKSLLLALKKVQSKYKVQVVIGLHDCTDKTEQNAEQLFHLFRNQKISIKFVKVKGVEGIVCVENAIVQTMGNSKYYFFMDADTVINDNHLRAMLEVIKDRYTYCAYSKTIPFLNNLNWVGKMMTIYDTRQELQTQRKYINGKTMLLKEWPLIEEYKKAQIRGEKLVNNYKYLNINNGLIADDIHLSRYLYYKYGVNSIKEVPEAKTYYNPINSLIDLYKYTRRICGELIRLDILFPEHGDLQHKYFKRGTNWTNFFAAKINVKCYWILYLIIISVMKLMCKFEYKLRGIFKRRSLLWYQTQSTKRRVNKHRLYIFEGLDCSGKKTIAYAVQKILHKRGVDVKVNLGPLVTNIYHHIARVCDRFVYMPNLFKSIIYGFEPLIDGLFYKPDCDITLQSSCHFRSESRARALRQRWYSILIGLTSKYYPNIDGIFYFYAPLRIRRQRHRIMVKKGLTNKIEKKRFMLNNVDKYHLWEDMLSDRCHNQKNFMGAYDTSKKSPESIAQKITNLIIENLYDDTKRNIE